MAIITNEQSLIHKGKNSLIYYQPESRFGVPVAVKVFPHEVPTTRQITCFKNESEITQALSVKGIRKTLGKTEVNGKTALILEYVEGNTLAELLATRGVFPIVDFLQMAISISHTLGELHRHHIIHRDINNNNILVHPQTLQTTIIDFGISSKIDTKIPHPGNPDSLEGTLTYISPEQTGRMNRVVDYRTDLYSLGVSFYAALTGQLPFVGKNSMELVHAHIAKKPAPPHQLNPGIPETLSRVVLRLLAKNAEHRYQSAYGLKHDLQKCLTQWNQTQNIGYFALGQQDYSGRFRLVEKLYGRKNEMQTLLAAFNRMVAGNRELVLVGGYSGIGKSALVNEMHKSINHQQGHFVKGKYDQLQRNIPYSAINNAFGEFCDHLLTLKEEDLNNWRTLIQKTVGNHGKILTEVIPNLRLIIGEQPEVAQIDAQESQNRFNQVMQNFVKDISTQNHPLVLFLDDLQWADLASLNLLRLLMNDEANQYLLIIGAYRNNEVHATHPFVLMTNEITENQLHSPGAKVTKITLSNLTREATSELIKDTLDCENSQQVAGLAQLVHEKTMGNAFFLTQLLKNIYEGGLLSFDFKTNRWTWEVEEIQAHKIADNVVELMTQKMAKLPDKTQKVLKLAACIGNQFDLQTLAIIGQNNVYKCFARLWVAITAGLVAPLDEHYQLYQNQLMAGKEVVEAKAGFRFIHDRVQQAAYALIAPEQQQAAHLKTGRLLLNNANGNASGESLFDIVNHLNLGKNLITDKGEQIRLARLNLHAGKQAKKSNAYTAAIAYFDHGIAFLGTQAWSLYYHLSLELHKERGEAEFLIGDFTHSGQSLDIALKQAKTDEDKIEVYLVKLSQLSGQGKYREGASIAIDALNMLGMNLPSLHEEVLDEAIAREMTLYKKNMRSRTIESLADLPLIADAAMARCIKITAIAIDSIGMYNPRLLVFCTTKIVNVSIAHGISSFVTNCYMFFAMTLSAYRDFSGAFRFARLALDINQKIPNDRLKCKIRHSYGFYSVLDEPYTTRHFNQAFGIGIEVGDFTYGGYASVVSARYKILTNLDEALKECEKAIAFTSRLGNVPMLTHARLCLGFVRCLSDPDLSLVSFEYDGFDQQMHDTLFDNAPLMFAFSPNFRLMAYALFGMYTEALPLVAQRHTWVEATGGLDLMLGAEYYFFSGITVSGLHEAASAAKKQEYLDILEECTQELGLLASECEINFKHLHVLLQAEKAKITGDVFAAMNKYEEGFKQACKHVFFRDQAIASELTARFYLSLKKEDIALLYWRQAHQHYVIWGATAKAKLLEKQYPRILHQNNPGKPLTSTVSVHTTNGSLLLDLDTILKSSQALSQQVKTDDLIRTMLHVVIENTGAEKGYLVAHTTGELLLRAKGNATESEVVKPAISLAICNDLPVSLISYVARSQQTEVLDDASIAEGKYASDAYVQAHQPRSVLCYPVLRQGELSIIFYLENNLATGAFTPQRLEMLRILSSQMAISIENALLYENLEQKVKLRTRQISEKNEELKKINEKLIELDDFKQGITGMIVHDLKNPLNTLLAFAESPEIKQSARQMLQMVSNILDVQKIESAGLQLHYGMLSLQALATEATSQVKIPSQQKNIRLQYAGARDFKIKADQEITLRILVNLLTNAIKHAPLNSTIELRTEVDQHKLKLWIIDEGKGVPEHLQTKIFDKFFSPDAHHDRRKSTGLGLAFCKLATEAQGGSIGVENIADKGAGFWLTLPLAASEAAPALLQTQPAVSNHPALTPEDKTVLFEIASQLVVLPIYEMGKIKKLADQVTTKTTSVQQWKEQLLEATFSMNETWFKELVGSVLG